MTCSVRHCSLSDLPLSDRLAVAARSNKSRSATGTARTGIDPVCWAEISELSPKSPKIGHRTNRGRPDQYGMTSLNRITAVPLSSSVPWSH